MAGALLGGKKLIDSGRRVGVKNVWSGVGFGDDLRLNRSVVDGATDSIALGIYDISQEGETIPCFFFGKIASARFFYEFWCGDLDSGFALAGMPETLMRFEMIRNNSSKICLHWLITLDREGEDAKKDGKWNRNNGQKWKNLKETKSKANTSTHNHKIDELAKGKRTEKLVVGFYVLRDLILRHILLC